MAKLKNNVDSKLKQIMNGFAVPDFASLNHNTSDFNVRYALALNYLNEMVDNDELVNEAKKYLTSVGRAADADKMDRMVYGTRLTVGKVCYCLNRGAELAPKSLLFVNKALDAVKPAVAEVESSAFEEMELGTAGRNIQVYVDCYSRIDNLKTLVLKNKLAMSELEGEIKKVLMTYGGDRTVIRKRLLAHYEDSLAEAEGDKLIKSWVKPLKIVVKTLGGDVKVGKIVDAKMAVEAPVVKNTANLTVQAPKAPKAPKTPGKAVKSKGKKSVNKASKRTRKAPTTKATKGEVKLFTLAGYAVFDGKVSLRVASGKAEVRELALRKWGATEVKFVALPRAMNKADALAFAASVRG